MSERLDVHLSLRNIKALAHNMLARYEMGLHNPVHRAKFDRKRRDLRESLDELDAWLDGGWLDKLGEDLWEQP